jgi:DNA recombination protein RmuC
MLPYSFLLPPSHRALCWKLLFSARFQSEKLVLKKNNCSKLPIQSAERTVFEWQNSFRKQLDSINSDKENIRNEKTALAIQLSKKEVDFENLWNNNKNKRQK